MNQLPGAHMKTRVVKLPLGITLDIYVRPGTNAVSVALKRRERTLLFLFDNVPQAHVLTALDELRDAVAELPANRHNTPHTGPSIALESDLITLRTGLRQAVMRGLLPPDDDSAPQGPQPPNVFNAITDHYAWVAKAASADDPDPPQQRLLALLERNIRKSDSPLSKADAAHVSQRLVDALLAEFSFVTLRR